jgi:hypothetical protein
VLVDRGAGRDPPARPLPSRTLAAITSLQLSVEVRRTMGARDEPRESTKATLRQTLAATSCACAKKFDGTPTKSERRLVREVVS